MDFSGLPTEEEIAEAERQANTVVLANERILAEYPCARELETLEYRSKKEIDGAGAYRDGAGSGCMRLLRNPCKADREIGPIKVTSLGTLQNRNPAYA